MSRISSPLGPLDASPVHEMVSPIPAGQACRDFEREPGSDDEHVDADQFDNRL